VFVGFYFEIKIMFVWLVFEALVIFELKFISFLMCMFL